MKVLHEGKPRTLVATVEQPISHKQGGEKLSSHLAGATFSDIEEGSRLYGRIEGVLVSSVDPGSPAWSAGLRPGDVIVSVNRKPVKSLDEMRDIASDNKELLLNVRRGNGALFLYMR
jgi:serine protease Do/serine protease DegQ